MNKDFLGTFLVAGTLAMTGSSHLTSRPESDLDKQYEAWFNGDRNPSIEDEDWRNRVSRLQEAYDISQMTSVINKDCRALIPSFELQSITLPEGHYDKLQNKFGDCGEIAIDAQIFRNQCTEVIEGAFGGAVGPIDVQYLSLDQSKEIINAFPVDAEYKVHCINTAEGDDG